jgi:predicted nucleotidyltransferase
MRGTSKRLVAALDYRYHRVMDREDALTILRENRAALLEKGVTRAALFGSTVRGEAGPRSDVDLLVDIDPAANLGVYEYVALTRFLRELFPVPVDVANRATLKPHVRPSAERDAVYAF